MVLSAPQTQALSYLHPDNTTVNQVLFATGAGPGKSTCGCIFLIEGAIDIPGSVGFIARRRLVDLQKTTLMTFTRLHQKYYGWFTYFIDNKYNVIKFQNGSMIFLVDLAYSPQDPEYTRLGSYEFTRGFVDECGECDERAINILFTRIRYLCPNGCPKMFMATNPVENYLKYKWIQDLEGNPVELEPYQKVVTSSLHDNPDKEFVKTYEKNLRTLPQYEQDRLLHASWNWIHNEDPFITEWRPKLHIVSCSISPLYPLDFSFDFNFKPTSVLLGQKTNERLEFQVEHQKDGGTELLCKELTPYLNHKNAVYATGDSSGNASSTVGGFDGGELVNDYHIIKKVLKLSPFQLVDTRTANKSHEYSRRLCNYVLKNVPCAFDPYLKVLIKDIQTAKVDINGKLIKDRKQYQLDMLDCFRYLVNRWFPNGIIDVDKYIKQINSRKLAMSR